MNPSSNHPSQQSKAVLVTGPAKRLGREIALQFAREGWDVAVHYGRSAQEAAKTVDEIQGLGVKARAFQADLADEIQVKNLFNAVSEAFPGLGCLVNSASIFEYDRGNSSTPLTGRSLSTHMQVNLTAPILLSQLMFEYQKSKNK